MFCRGEEEDVDRWCFFGIWAVREILQGKERICVLVGGAYVAIVGPFFWSWWLFERRDLFCLLSWWGARTSLFLELVAV